MSECVGVGVGAGSVEVVGGAESSAVRPSGGPAHYRRTASVKDPDGHISVLRMRPRPPPVSSRIKLTDT